jgi:Uncharacterised nucleotidyltransferase
VTVRRDGPLGKVGPATRWCLTAGIVEDSRGSPSCEEFEQEAESIICEGLAPVAYRALANRSEHQGTHYLESFHRLALAAEMRSMATTVAALRILDELAADGISFAVIKGPAMAMLHPKGWPRPYSDVDIVVPANEFHRAIELCNTLGFAAPESGLPHWKWFDLTCREGVNLHSGGAGNIDLHHHLPPWALGSDLSSQAIILRSHPESLCGALVNYASREDLLVISALHTLNDLWKHKLGLPSWRDFMILTKQMGELDARRAFERARLGWLYDLMVGEIVSALPESGIEPPEPRPLQPFGPKLRLAALGWSNDSALSRHRLAWAARLPLLNAAAFLLGVILPSPAYVHSRHGSYRKYWKTSLQETVSTARGSDYRLVPAEEHR